MQSNNSVPDDWYPGSVPGNVILGQGCYFETSYSLRRFFSRHPQGLVLGAHAACYANTQFATGRNASITVGEYTMLNGVFLNCQERIDIGCRVLVAWDVMITDTEGAPYGAAPRRAWLRQSALDRHGRLPPAAAAPVVIEDDVWIGFGCIILPGVRIGAGSVIGARSVVAQDVPAGVIACGNPARIVREVPRAAGDLTEDLQK